MKMFMNNIDCDLNIQSFLNLTALAKMMGTNRRINKHSMALLGKAYKKKTPVKGLMHLGRLILGSTQERAKKYLIPGLQSSEAVLKSECMVCHKKCSNTTSSGVLEYGFMAHNSCLKGETILLDGAAAEIGFGGVVKTRIELDMVPHLHGLRKRKRTTGDCIRYDVILSGINNVFPHELSFEGYCENNMRYILDARLTAARESIEEHARNC